MSELKLCPFCGGKGFEYKTTLGRAKMVECAPCRIRMTFKDWQNRPAESALQQEVERLRGMVEQAYMAGYQQYAYCGCCSLEQGWKAFKANHKALAHEGGEGDELS